MADLYHLLDDDALRNDGTAAQNHQEEVEDISETANDDEPEDREQVYLPDVRPSVTPTADQHGEQSVDRVDLVDVLLPQERNETQQLCQELLQYWTQEKAAPELLPIDDAWLERITESLQELEQRIETRAIAATTAAAQPSHLTALLTSMAQLDLERGQYVVADLLKTRLDKITRHALYYAAAAAAAPPQQQQDKARILVSDNLLEAERDFLQNYGRLWETHLTETVTQHFTQDVWKQLDEPDMVEAPDLDAYVFCQVGPEPVVLVAANEKNDTATTTSMHEAHTRLIVTYRRVQHLHAAGKVRLLA